MASLSWNDIFAFVHKHMLMTMMMINIIIMDLFCHSPLQWDGWSCWKRKLMTIPKSPSLVGFECDRFSPFVDWKTWWSVSKLSSFSTKPKTFVTATQQHCVMFEDHSRASVLSIKSPRTPFELRGSVEQLWHTKWEPDFIPHLNVASPPVTLSALFNQPFILSIFLPRGLSPFSFPHQPPGVYSSLLALVLSAGVACLCWDFWHYFTLISCLIWSCLSVLWILDYPPLPLDLFASLVRSSVFWPFPELNK